MRLALTNDLHANGGAMSLMAVRYARALAAAGHHCTLITGRKDHQPPDDIPSITWDYPQRGSGLIGAYQLAKQIRKRSAAAFAQWVAESNAEGQPPDGWLALVIPSADGALRAGGAKLPLLYICNSPWAMEWDAAYEIGHGQPAPWWRRLPALLPRRRMERGVVNQAAGWTSLSQLQLDWFMSEHPGCGAIPKRVISGAVDCDAIQPLSMEERLAAKRRAMQQHGAPEDLPLIVCSRRLVARTGVDLLVEAHGRMQRDAMLVVTGDGQELPALREQAAKSPRSKLVAFRGFVPWAELRELTAAADLAVLPTRALEGFGLSAAEAFASGTPVVATPITALLDVVGGLDKRLLAERVDAPTLAVALDRALSDPELTGEAFRARCREHALRFDWNRLQSDFVGWAETCFAGPTL